MAEISVGKDILSYCSKCKLNLSHIIVTMKTEEVPHRCKCNTCKAVHVYRDPNKPVKKVVRKSTRAQTQKVSTNLLWEEQMKKNAHKSERKYAISAKFEVGDVIDHPHFGQGVAQRLLDKHKVEFLFKYEIKMLIHNK